MARAPTGRPPVSPLSSSELVHAGAGLRGHTGRPYSSSSLLSSIDDALRSLDEAITAEDELVDAEEVDEETKASGALALLAGASETCTERLSGSWRSHSSERGQLPQISGREVPRVHTGLEPAARWLQAVLRSCVQARQADAFSRLTRTAACCSSPRPAQRWTVRRFASGNSETRRHRGSASAALPSRGQRCAAVKRGPSRTEQMMAFALAAGRVVRHHERHECLAALHRWRDAALLARLHAASQAFGQEDGECEMQENERPGTPGGVRRAVASIEQRQSMPGQLAAAEAENRWLRRAVHRERLLQRSLVQFAIRLQQVKSEAFSKLKQHAVAFQVSPTPRARQNLSQYDPVQYEGQTRVIGARWLVCLLVQAQLRSTDVAWRHLVVHTEYDKGKQLLAESRYSPVARLRLREALQNLEAPSQGGGGSFDGGTSGEVRGAGPLGHPADDWVCTTVEVPRPQRSPLELFRPSSTCTTIQEWG